MKGDIAILVAEGFEEVEVITMVNYGRRAGLKTHLISIDESLQKKGSRGVSIICDSHLSAVSAKNYAALYLPGGMPGSTNLRDNEAVIKLIQEFHRDNRWIAAICAAPIILEKAGLTKNKTITCYPAFKSEITYACYKEDAVVCDGKLITSRGPATAHYLALYLIRKLRSSQNSSAVADSTLWSSVEEKIKHRDNMYYEC